MTTDGAATSPAALEFIRTQVPRPHPRVTRANVAAVRSEYRATFVEDHDALLERYPVDAEEAELGGVPTLRVRPRRPPEIRATLLYLFGGAFVAGGPIEDLRITAPLAVDLGVEIHSPRYRLAPEHPYPAARDDAVSALTALLDSRPPSEVAVMGESAGGNLALTTVLHASELGLSAPAAVALCSPWADLGLSGDSWAANDGRDPTMTAAGYDHSARLYAGDLPVDHPEVSPLFAQYDRSFPDTLITTGTRDLVLSTCVRLATVLRRAGVDVSLRVHDGMWHVFEYTWQLPEAQESLRDTAEFLGRRLGIRTRR